MAKIQRPTEVNYGGVESAYEEFEWVLWDNVPIKYEDLIQVKEPSYPANARGFIVENEVWFDEDPPSNHEKWWDDIISDNYDRDWTDEPGEDEHRIIYIRIPQDGYFQVPFPRLVDFEPEVGKRLGLFMQQEMEVPRDVKLTWAMSEAGIVEMEVGEFYDAVI